MKTGKKVLSLVLAVIMCVTSIPLIEFDFKAGATEYKVGDIIEFGSYPQTQVTDSTIISALNSISATWRSYGYMSGSGTGWCDGSAKESDYMKYKDVTYNDERYRAVEFSTYRPGLVTYKSTETCFNYQASNGYTINNVYWFKFEPVQWKILDPSKGLVLCESIIDSQAFNNNLYATGNTSTWWADYWKDSARTIHANNYTNSDIKDWLNDDFYYTAFTESQRKLINSQTVGKISLLTRNDTTNSSYGFINDGSRKASGTDYAKAQGLRVSNGTSIWMTQSAASSLGINISCVHFDGHTFDRESNDYGHTSMTFHGVRPAMCVDLDAVKEENIYNMGEETYSFNNYVDEDSPGGHCFGMSITSSGYHLGLLDHTYVGANSSREIYNLVENDTVKGPICYFQDIQGSIRDRAMVAGGANYKDDDIFDVFSDWDEVTNYVKNHEYDNLGTLQIGYIKYEEGAHAVNFLRYEVVDGQERIYAYDNNCPHQEVYFCEDEVGSICHSSEECQFGCAMFTGIIDCIALRHIPTYLEAVSSVATVQNIIKTSIYAITGHILIQGAPAFIMETNGMCNKYYMYEIPEDITTVKITPLVDNATFTYMGQEYKFGEIDENTYAEFTLATSENDVPEFEIINNPEDDPEIKDCSCKCHKTDFFAKLIWKITIFFQKLFKKNAVCTCGVAHY